jgi:hypothetical protein
VLYSKQEVRAMLDLSGVRRKVSSDREFLQKTGELAEWLKGRDRWKLYGPYWPALKTVMAEYQPELNTAEWNDGQPAPDFLSLYDYGEAALNLAAAMMYLNRGEHFNLDPDAPHSINMPDGSEALYVPGVGLIDQ